MPRVIIFLISQFNVESNTIPIKLIADKSSIKSLKLQKPIFRIFFPFPGDEFNSFVAISYKSFKIVNPVVADGFHWKF